MSINKGGPKSLFDDDKDLQTLAIKCCETADELTAELETLKPQGRHKTLQAIKKTIRGVRRKPVVDEIQRKLDRYRNVVETRTMANLRFVQFWLKSLFAHDPVRAFIWFLEYELMIETNRKRHDIASIEQRDGFKNLDSKVQSLVIGLAAGQKSFDELSELIHQDNLAVKEHIAEEFHQYRTDFAEKEYCQKFTESLHFPSFIYVKKRFTKLTRIPSNGYSTSQAKQCDPGIILSSGLRMAKVLTGSMARLGRVSRH